MSEESEVVETILNIQTNLVHAMENIQTNLVNTMSNVQNNIENRLIDPTNMSIISQFPRDFTGIGTSSARFSEELNKSSLFNIDFKGAGEYEGNTFELVSSGEVNSYIAPDYYWTGIDPSFTYFTSSPGDFPNSINRAAWILFGEGQTLWDELSAKYNIKPLMVGATGIQAFYWSNKKYEKVDDLKGEKWRQPGPISKKALEKLGIIVEDISGGDLYDALKDGLIDATEWITAWNDYDLKFHTVVNYAHYVNPMETSTLLTLGINLDYWNNLSIEQRTMIENFSKAETFNAICQYQHNDAISINKMKTENPNLNYVEFSEEIQKAFNNAVIEAQEEYAQTSEETNKIWRSINEYTKNSKILSNIQASVLKTLGDGEM